MGIVESFELFAIGIGPMGAALYLALRPHEKKFDYNRAMIMLAIGMIAGVFVAAGHFLLESGVGSLLVLLSVEALLALLTNTVLLLAMNRGRLAGRHDSPFLALVLGAGMGSMMPLIQGFYFLYLLEKLNLPSQLPPEIVLQLLALSGIQVFMRSAGASLIAYGSYVRSASNFAIYSVALQLAVYAILAPAMLQSSTSPDYGVIAASYGGALLLSSFMFVTVVWGLLPKCVPPTAAKKKIGESGAPATASLEKAKGLEVAGADGAATWRTGR